MYHPAVINHTSVEDIAGSLKLMDPKTGFEIRNGLEYLNRSLDYEVKNQNRSSVIKLLRAKINKVKKLKPGEIMAEKCKISDYTCIYHACRSDDCQKKYMNETGGDFGIAKCDYIPAVVILPDCLHNRYCDMQTTTMKCMSNVGCNFRV